MIIPQYFAHWTWVPIVQSPLLSCLPPLPLGNFPLSTFRADDKGHNPIRAFAGSQVPDARLTTCSLLQFCGLMGRLWVVYVLSLARRTYFHLNLQVNTVRSARAAS